ncbi:hypothetical protein HBI25_179400 [Parastagonospora nodorum]|nr:hypothetical protein HBI25_179400 [Parastagonospora nodorum]
MPQQTNRMEARRTMLEAPTETPRILPPPAERRMSRVGCVRLYGKYSSRMHIRIHFSRALCGFETGARNFLFPDIFLALPYGNCNTIRNVRKEQPRSSTSYTAPLIGTSVSRASSRMVPHA